MSNTTRTRIIPRSDLKLRDPKTGRPIPPEGIVIRGPIGNFWHKRASALEVELKTED